MQTLRLFWRLSRPYYLIGAALLYALGVGIARYLGNSLDWHIYLLGQAWVTLLQLSTHYLNEYYDAEYDQLNPNRTAFSGGSGAVGPGKLTRQAALYGGVACLAALASLTVLLIRDAHLSPATGLIMVLAFLGAFFYSVPPVRLITTGYGELVAAIIVANLLPAFAYLLQTGEFHRLLAMTTFPLTALCLAMSIDLELPDYATDLKYEKRTLLVRIGWQNGMRLHNGLIIIAFLLFGLDLYFGLPFAIVLPVFFVLPVGIYAIWQLRKIDDGAKPNWSLLAWTATLMFATVIYLLSFAYWTR